jgi:hypothetical protein
VRIARPLRTESARSRSPEQLTQPDHGISR